MSFERVCEFFINVFFSYQAFYFHIETVVNFRMAYISILDPEVPVSELVNKNAFHCSPRIF